MATTPKTTKAARILADYAAFTAQEQTEAEVVLNDQAHGGHGITKPEAAALVDLIADLRRAAAAAAATRPVTVTRRGAA
jgi:hypothetical protein